MTCCAECCLNPRDFVAKNVFALIAGFLHNSTMRQYTHPVLLLKRDLAVTSTH